MLKKLFGQFDRPAKIIKCGETGDFYVEEKEQWAIDNGQMTVDNYLPEGNSMEYKVLGI